MKIIIDPRFRINYASYYLKGLWDVFGVKNVMFESKYFLKENLYNNVIDYNKCLVMVAEQGTISKKIIIDFDDSDSISIKHYNWCDVYAKINVTKQDILSYDKIIAIGPSFGINLVNFHTLLTLLKLLFIKDKPVSNITYVKNFLYMQIRRRPYKSYLKSESKKDYIFAISTLWYDPLTYETTNKYRLVFFETCRRIFKKVEGGFFYIDDINVLNQFPQYIGYKEKYNNFLYRKRVTPKEYLLKTKKSTLVFNTPSVSGCHGWKLAEYCAMGKAIISTPLNNVMPDGLQNKNNIMIVQSEIELEKVVKALHSNILLVKKMEIEASEYFNKILSPSSVVNRIMSIAFQK